MALIPALQASVAMNASCFGLSVREQSVAQQNFFSVGMPVLVVPFISIQCFSEGDIVKGL